MKPTTPAYTPGTFFFGTPYSRVGASASYIESLVQFSYTSTRTDPRLVGYKVSVGTSYGQQRNAIVNAAIEAKAEWVLMIDDDIRFPPDIVASLALTPSWIVIGAVPVSQTEMNIWESDDEGRISPDSTIPPPEGKVQWADAPAYGCAVALIHMCAIGEIAERYGTGSWFNCHTITESKAGKTSVVQLEPDLSFALRAKRSNIRAIARYDIPLTHSKPIELRY